MSVGICEFVLASYCRQNATARKLYLYVANSHKLYFGNASRKCIDDFFHNFKFFS